MTQETTKENYPRKNKNICPFFYINRHFIVGLNFGLNKTEKKVIEFLIENPSFTSDNLAEKIGVTKRTIERTLKKLQEKKMIERIGSKRDGNWIVIK